MQWNVEKALRELFATWYGSPPDTITPLPPSGSNRLYFRMRKNGQTCIGSYNPDIRENQAFLYLSRHFSKIGLPVPEILAEDKDGYCYLITDLGDTTLFSLLPHDPGVKSFPGRTMGLYKKAIDQLPAFQVKGSKGLNFGICYPRHAFDRYSMMWDLNYFKYYFLKISGTPFDEQKLEEDFERFTKHLLKEAGDFFMYRDFQSRNIMVVDETPFFIDYQGGRRGPLQYDIASLLYDAKANIPFHQREELLAYYLEKVNDHMPVNEKAFTRSFYDFVVMRILQALGTYGFRGGVEKKTLFLQSVPFALNNLKRLAANDLLPANTPHLRGILENIAESSPDEILPSPQNGLTVRIKSFSYKRGIPADPSGNGGGFVFDCRALPNPGREEKYRPLTGKDLEVIAFLEEREEVARFMESTNTLVEKAVDNYLEREFNSLMVCFGCTGGQHRSVYFSEALARKLEQKKGVKVELEHCEAPNWPG